MSWAAAKLYAEPLAAQACLCHDDSEHIRCTAASLSHRDMLRGYAFEAPFVHVAAARLARFGLGHSGLLCEQHEEQRPSC